MGTCWPFGMFGYYLCILVGRCCNSESFGNIFSVVWHDICSTDSVRITYRHSTNPMCIGHHITIIGNAILIGLDILFCTGLRSSRLFCDVALWVAIYNALGPAIVFFQQLQLLTAGSTPAAECVVRCPLSLVEPLKSLPGRICRAWRCNFAWLLDRMSAFVSFIF